MMIKESVKMPKTERINRLYKICQFARCEAGAFFIVMGAQFINDDLIPEQMIWKLIIAFLSAAVFGLTSDILDYLKRERIQAEQDDLYTIMENIVKRGEIWVRRR